MSANPFAHLAAAARGDIEAQRVLAMLAVEGASASPGDAESILREGLIFARLAAAQGDTGDEGRVIAMLALLAEVSGDNAPYGEAIARYALLDERGIEVPGMTLEMLSDHAPAEVMLQAKCFHQLIQEVA